MKSKKIGIGEIKVDINTGDISVEFDNEELFEDKEEKPTLEPGHLVFYNMMKAMFNGDPRIEVCNYHKDKKEFDIQISDYRLYNIMHTCFIIPEKYGECNVNVNYVGESKEQMVSDEEMAYIFKENPYFSGVFDGGTFKSLMFKKKVVQYVSGNLFHPRKVESDLMENLAKEIFFGRYNFKTEIEE